MPRGGVQTSLVGMVQTMIAPFRGREGPGKGAQGPLNTGAAPGAKVTSLGCYITFELAEMALSRQMFADILSLIARAAGTACAGMTSASQVYPAMKGEVCLGRSKAARFSVGPPSNHQLR